ncbi:MAG: protein kinase [Myxococcales bacterium]|nr:protein kinase [Myxococcales bacterium]
MDASRKSEDQTQLDEQLGRVLAGRYRLEAPLGEGGIGRVYSGTHLKLGRRVAIKVLNEAYRDNDSLQRRFEREAMALSALSHPHVVTVIDYGTEGDLAYIVMELVEGRDLAQILNQGPLPPVRAMSIMRQLLRGLVYAHQNGLIHRDLKPANIMVRKLPDGAEHVHVLDFGLAKFLAEETNDQLTNAGHVLGTPAYMSPEQSSAEATDARTDVYAAGLIFFEMLVGHGPFHPLTGAERVRRQLTGPAPKLGEFKTDLPELASFEAFLARALAPSKKDRFADASEMLAAFQELPALDLMAEGDNEGTRKTLTLGNIKPHRPLRFAMWIALTGFVCLALGWGVGILGTPRTEELVAARKIDLHEMHVRPDPRDPWKGPIPPELEELKRQIDTGAAPSKKDLGPVYRYMRFHPTDPRPHLLLAQTFFDRQWTRDAVTQYVQAYEKDPSSRGAPRMLPDLITLAMDPNRVKDAAAALRQIYGEEALQVLDSRLALERDPEVQKRLHAVIAHVESGASLDEVADSAG